MTQCPWCAAHNPRDARWCGQCLQRFDAGNAGRPVAAATGDAAAVTSAAAVTGGPVTAPHRGREPVPAQAGEGGFPVVPPAPTADGNAATAADGHTPPGPGARRRTGVDTGAFLVDGDTVRWRCPACESINELEAWACTTCGTALAERDRPDVDWELARRRAVLAPGLGHLAADHAATGWARLLLATVWLLGALSLLLTGGTAALAPALMLVAGVAALWVGGVVDVERLARGRTELLSARALLWLVVGVLMAVLLTLVARAAPPAV